MNKKIGIYFSDEDKRWYPFHKIEYLEAYSWLIASIEKHNIDVVIVRWNSYLWKGIFNNVSKLEGTKVINIVWETKVDLIFNRDDKNTIPKIQDCPIINHPDFDELCVDKLKTFQRFPDISPKTAYIHSYEEYLEKLDEFNFSENTMIVLKKNFETEWNGIYIWKVWELEKDFYSNWEHLLFQEFIDSSIWIPDVIEGLHDIRITIVNKKPISSYIRAPKKWSYLANIAQWWSWLSISLNQVPKELFDIIESINNNIGEYFPIIYSADFMNSEDWFKLVELNSRPWLQHPNWFDWYSDFNNAVWEMLIEAIKSI